MDENYSKTKIGAIGVAWPRSFRTTKETAVKSMVKIVFLGSCFVKIKHTECAYFSDDYERLV